MNDLKSFNRALEYIDNHLNSEIEKSEIYRLTTYSYEVFSRIFSILSGVSLGEYIRTRRLSKAAMDLQETTKNVSDIAMIYGYNSSDAFSYAFKRFHGHSPSNVRAGQGFHVVQPLRFSISIRGGEFETKIEEKEAFQLFGICENVRPDMMSVEIWQELCQKLQGKSQSEWIENRQLYGLYFQGHQDSEVRYMIGYKLTGTVEQDCAKDLGLTIVNIPTRKYAVVKLEGEVPTNIHQAWKHLIGTFLPQEGYKYSESYDFELYSGSNVYAPNFTIELWVPIERK